MAAPSRQVALLRGINVGRNKRIAMADLRALLEDVGYTDVRTHLQSGNAIFSSPARPDEVVRTLEEGLARSFSLEVAVVVRTGKQLAAVVEANPLGDVATDPAKHLVGFLGGAPDWDGVRDLEQEDFAPNLVRLIGREVHLWCPNGVLGSPFGQVDWDQRLGVPVTMRNWRTVTKLLELARD